ncbi:hypothetical protein [Streptomyces griseorubiginosus]|uniref:hypothetical protein n=1 Tax=Streptomyces griseorubiginosus TaxID=67304 RepID=UPI00076DDE3B|nr:hypothetical protein [Streptomyces griseorubiginosus]KUM73964.1 hypothetical protein AQI84_24080 [Streptomyces griseorubiginosus]
MRRSTFRTAATATALSVTLLAGLSPAQADGAVGGPVLDSAEGCQGPGLACVTAHSDSPLTRITAHFFPLDAPADAPEAGSTEDFTQYSGTDATSGTWRAPVHLADLGDYRVTVDLQDASGATLTGALSPYDLAYRTVVTIPDLSVTPGTPDYLHQQVTVSGTALAEDPRHPGTRTPAAGVPVLIDTWRGRLNATTAADGRFGTTFVPTDTTMYVSATPLASDDYPGAIDVQTPKQFVQTFQAPVRFTASTHTLNLRQGATGTVTGRAEIQTTAGWQPLPHSTISVLGLDADGRPDYVVGETTTDGQGAYTLHVSSYTPAPTAELVVGEPYMPFQQQATEPFSLHVAYTTHLDMNASLNDDASLAVSGWVYFEDPDAKWPAKPTVTLQYSQDGKSGWKNATTLPIKILHNKPLFPETFARTFTTPDSTAYWRARFNGNPDLATSTTKPVHLYRYATRVTGFHGTPDPVRRNQSISFAGTLQYKNGTTWKPLGGQAPTLYFRPRGSSTYHYVTELDSDRHGHLIGMVTAERDGTWALALSRQTGDHYLRSPRVTAYVDVR